MMVLRHCLGGDHEGTLVFIAPGQVVKVDNTGDVYQPKGYALVFHPDLIPGTPLGRHQHELEHAIDKHSKSVSQIAYELGFKYPQHFTRLFKQRIGQSPNEYRMVN